MKRVIGGSGGWGPRILSVRAQMLASCSREVAWKDTRSSVPSGILLMLVLADGEAVLQRSPGDPSEEWASFPAFRSVTQTESAPLCCSFLMGRCAESPVNTTDNYCCSS